MSTTRETGVLLEDLHRLREDAATLLESLRRSLEHAADVARAGMERNHYAVLAASVGVGLVLGGGVPVRALRRALGLGLQVAVTRAVSAGLASSMDATGSSPPSELHAPT